MGDVLVVAGPGVVPDAGLLAEVAAREFTALGVRGALVHARDAAHLLSLARGGAVVIPGPSPEVRELIGQPIGPVVWVDVERADDVAAGEGATHLHGRGISGLAWGIRHAVHRMRHPSRRIAYGASRDQWGDLYVPGGARNAPVVVLIHGGYWRSIWAADLMEALCADLTGRGFAVWNLEYRRPDLHGWQSTTADVAAGLAALDTVNMPAADAHPDVDLGGGAVAGSPALDLGRVAVVGHSAGAQLALRAVADGVRVALAVSLAGVLDLVEGDRRWLSSGAVAAALGHPSTEAAARRGAEEPAHVYRVSSPLLRLPLNAPQLIVQGTDDDLDLIDFSRRYARAAQHAGDEVTYLEMSGDHFAVITPSTPIWQATAEAITTALA
ncbi:alpha/beta hydrolase family protein [Nonomuraea sp. M3C6]|uniref:Alpha/beta hydrolase family protein n=1 Tax=Nonomuraea marmarensis TaxID=3351344 RepID=A0ABW7APH6_9ACTN